MTTEQTSVAAIEWTVQAKNKDGTPAVDKQGKPIIKALYRPLELSAALVKEREAWLEQEEIGRKMREVLDGKIKAILAGLPFGKAVPAGYELVVAHKYGPAFTALPVKVKGAKRNAVKIAA